MDRYVALLRGINVGGKNLIKMVELKACFEEEGFLDVLTYIQSGNVVFRCMADARLASRIEKAVEARFAYPAAVVLRSEKQMRRIVEGAPDGFGAQPKKRRYDVIFLKEPLTASAAMKSVPLKEGVDEAYPGPSVLYTSRLISKASQSQLRRLTSLPVYRSMTIRNWNTTMELWRMMRPSTSKEGA